MIFEAVGGDGIAKLKSEEPGHGKHLYLFTVEREWEVAARKRRIVGLYEGEWVPQASLRSGRTKRLEKGTRGNENISLGESSFGICWTEFRLQN